MFWLCCSDLVNDAVKAAAREKGERQAAAPSALGGRFTIDQLVWYWTPGSV